VLYVLDERRIAFEFPPEDGPLADVERTAQRAAKLVLPNRPDVLGEVPLFPEIELLGAQVQVSECSGAQLGAQSPISEFAVALVGRMVEAWGGEPATIPTYAAFESEP
jgi:hypothetical protein